MFKFLGLAMLFSSIVCASSSLPFYKSLKRTQEIHFQPAPTAFIFDNEEDLESPYFKSWGSTSLEFTPSNLVLLDGRFFTETRGDDRRIGVLKLLLIGQYALSDAKRPEAQRTWSLSDASLSQRGDELLNDFLAKEEYDPSLLKNDTVLLSHLAEGVAYSILTQVGYTPEDIKKLRQLLDWGLPLPHSYEELHRLTGRSFIGRCYDKISSKIKGLFC